MADSWCNVPNIGKENINERDINDSGHFSKIVPAIVQVFKLLQPYCRDKPLIIKSSQEAGVSMSIDAEEKPGRSDAVCSAAPMTEDEIREDTEGSVGQFIEPGVQEEEESSSDSYISTSSESSATSDSEVEDINLAKDFSKLDLDGMLKSADQRVSLRKLFKPGEYEALCRFEQKRVIRIENKLTLMLGLKLPLPNEDIIREKIGLPRHDITLSDSSGSESDDDWNSRLKNGQLNFRGISDEDMSVRMAFIARYCEDRATGKRIVQQVSKKIVAKSIKIRRIVEEKGAKFEAFKNKVGDSQNDRGEKPSTSPQYNTRTSSDVRYLEEYVPENDHFVYCEDCKKMYVDDCPDHPLTLMKDSEAKLGVENYAKRTCPSGLSIDPSSIRNAGYGVWADVPILKNTVFGPYKGEIIKKYDAKSLVKVCNGGYSWEIYYEEKLVHYIDGSDPTLSNWLRYVNCARFEEEQNLVAFQYRGQIFYRALSDIKPSTEMFVWYGTHYALQLGIQEKLKSQYPQLTKKCFNVEHSNIVEAKGTKRNKAVLGLTDGGLQHKTGFACCHCRKEYTNKSSLQWHVQDIHEKTKDFRCKTCGKTTGSSTALCIHMRIHTGEKPYKCDVCGKRFSQSTNLITHKRTHTGEMPYKCDVCGKRFSQRAHLITHKRTHTGEMPYKCDVCGKRFSRSTNLIRHNRTHTGICLDPRNIRSFKVQMQLESE